MKISDVLTSNYLPYAKEVITERALPYIDGLKPSQRRLLYTMYGMKLLKGDRAKAQRINGQTLAIHPHGDSSVYQTMILMTDKNEKWNLPFIDGKGTFGKVYSRDLPAAAPRYTEAKLSPICNEVFESLDENAVDFVDNFDATTKEPTMLPVKFPSILVNSVSGVAVGKATNIPSFALDGVCDATIGILDGKINSVVDTMKVIGIPEYPTGGVVTMSNHDIISLGERGFGRVQITGRVQAYPNKIVITEIPYITTVEDIIDDIKELRDTEFKDVSDVDNQLSYEGMQIEITLKRGANVDNVLKKLFRYTKLRTSTNYSIKVIIDGKCKELGVYSLLKEWINFRLNTIKRIYEFRCSKLIIQEKKLSAWEKISKDLKKVVEIITSKSEVEAKVTLVNQFSLTNEQVEYLLDMKIRQFTSDNLHKKLKELQDIRNEIDRDKDVIEKESRRKEICIEELKEIKKKYATPHKTQFGGEFIKNENTKIEEEPISDEPVTVVLTNSGMLKRLTSTREINNFEPNDGDKEFRRWVVKNTGYMVVFTRNGESRKIRINDIDASRGKMKERLVDKAGLDSLSELLHIDCTDDLSGGFSIVYPTGTAVYVGYCNVPKRAGKITNLYPDTTGLNVLTTMAHKYFIFTSKRKAAYADITTLINFTSKHTYKIARLGNDERLMGISEFDKIKDNHKINLARYSKKYTMLVLDNEIFNK